MALEQDDKYICLCDKCLAKYSEKCGALYEESTCVKHRFRRGCYFYQLTRIHCLPVRPGQAYPLPQYPLPGFPPHKHDQEYREHFQQWFQQFVADNGGVSAFARAPTGVMIRQPAAAPGPVAAQQPGAAGHSSQAREPGAAGPSSRAQQHSQDSRYSDFVPYDGILDEDTTPLSPQEARRASLSGIPGVSADGESPRQPQVPEWLQNRQPGCDGSSARSRLQKRHYHLHSDATEDMKQDLLQTLLNILLLKVQHPGLGHGGSEGVLDLIGCIRSCDETFKKSLPDNFRAMLTALEKQFGLDMSTEYIYDLCPLCYWVYRNGPTRDSSQDDHCPFCATPRYEETRDDRKKARLQIVMRSIKEFIKRVYKHPELAYWADYHSKNIAGGGNLCDFQDGKAYQQAMKDKRFRDNPFHLLMGLITDGVQPYKDDNKYSIWPLVATFYNWPPWMRYLLGITTLLGVIPGSRIPASRLTLQPVLDIIMDQLLLLDQAGVEVFNAATKQTFICHVKLVQIISDIRGLEKLLELASTPALFGCFFCWIKGFRCCRKTVYCGHHTRLPLGHPLRVILAELLERHQVQGKCNCPELPTDSTLAPAARTADQIKQALRQPPSGQPSLQQCPTVISRATEPAVWSSILEGRPFATVRTAEPDDHSSDSGTEQEDNTSEQHGRKRRRTSAAESDSSSDESDQESGSSSDSDDEIGFEDGDDDDDNDDDEVSDEGQIEDESNGEIGASSPSDDGEQDLAERQPALSCAPDWNPAIHAGYDGMHDIGGCVSDTFTKSIQGSRSNPTWQAYDEDVLQRRGYEDGQQPYNATSEELAACTEALEQITAATSSRVTGNHFTRLLSPSKKNKTHASFVLASPFGLYVLSTLEGLGKEQKATYHQLLTACNSIQSKTFTASQLKEAEGQLLLAVCMVEAFMSGQEMDAKLHALTHLADKVRNTGPLWVTSMFVYESMWAKLVSWATNQAIPELTIIRAFCDYELAMFAFWKSPNDFSVPAVSRLTAEYAEEVKQRYQVPIDRPDRDLVSLSVKPKPIKRGDTIDPKLWLALHQYYCDYQDGYRELFEEFMMHWYNNKLTPAMRSSYSIAKVQQRDDNGQRIGQHVLSYSVKGLKKALAAWEDWVREVRQQQQQQPHRAAAEPASIDVSAHERWAGSMSRCSVILQSEATINDSRVVPVGHQRDREFSWVLLRRWDNVGHMCFMHVRQIFSHSDATGTRHTLLWGDLHSSKTATGGINVDAFIGVPAFSAVPDTPDRGVLPVSYGSCIDHSQVATSTVAVVPHKQRAGILLALSRHPASLYEAANYPLPEWL